MVFARLLPSERLQNLRNCTKLFHMISEKSLVAYKNKPALVIGLKSAETNEKITISLAGGEKLKVREKDIEFLHHGPCSQADIEALFPIGSNSEETALRSPTTWVYYDREFHIHKARRTPPHVRLCHIVRRGIFHAWIHIPEWQAG